MLNPTHYTGKYAVLDEQEMVHGEHMLVRVKGPLVKKQVDL